LDFFTYIVASDRNGTLYVGSTDDVLVRTAQHQQKTFSGFTARYGIDRLVWFERHPTETRRFDASGRSRSGNAAGSCE